MEARKFSEICVVIPEDAYNIISYFIGSAK